MQIITADDWQEYQLLDSGNSSRLEKFGPVTIVRPDPQAIWQPQLPATEWKKANATFQKETESKGHWKIQGTLPERWPIHYKDLTLWLKLTPFKHTGLFPEQAAQWDWMREKIKQSTTPVKVLNLFAYTGGASIAAAAAGAQVTHVDASRSSIGWAKDNQELSGLQDKPIRWILDDAIKFCEREVRRGNKYHGIIMDPPSYGHGPDGETWKFQESFPKLLSICQQLLDDQSLFIIVNAYAISSSALMLENMLQDTTKNLGGTIEVGELALQQQGSTRKLSTGIFGRWSR